MSKGKVERKGDIAISFQYQLGMSPLSTGVADLTLRGRERLQVEDLRTFLLIGDVVIPFGDIIVIGDVVIGKNAIRSLEPLGGDPASPSRSSLLLWHYKKTKALQVFGAYVAWIVSMYSPRG
jgi:hypothetical protein